MVLRDGVSNSHQSQYQYHECRLGCRYGTIPTEVSLLRHMWHKYTSITLLINQDLKVHDATYRRKRTKVLECYGAALTLGEHRRSILNYRECRQVLRPD
jgi:hypothetical protein